VRRLLLGTIPVVIALLLQIPHPLPHKGLAAQYGTGNAPGVAGEPNENMPVYAQSTERGPESRSKDAAQHPKEYSFAIPPEEPIVRYTRWLVIVAVLQFVTFVAQGIISFFTLRRARQAADAAVTSADMASVSATAQLRPYVFIKEFKYASHADQLNPDRCSFWSISPLWENVGTTPTRGLRINDNYAVPDAPIPADFSFADSMNDYNTPLHIGPHGSVYGAEIRISSDIMLAVQNQTKHLYIWGWAKYGDLFDSRGTRVTKFARRVQVRGNPIKPLSNTNRVELIFTSIPMHNCSDGECA
jgi:hypothetical protein